MKALHMYRRVARRLGINPATFVANRRTEETNLSHKQKGKYRHKFCRFDPLRAQYVIDDRVVAEGRKRY
jgi:hypothetical protein